MAEFLPRSPRCNIAFRTWRKSATFRHTESTSPHGDENYCVPIQIIQFVPNCDDYL